MKLSIISDDFTGANDIGIQLRNYGLEVFSLLEDIDVDADVKVISSESRNIDSELAKEKVSSIFNKLKKDGFDRFYKKIDSTLRGNINAEIEAILENIDEKDKICIIIGFPETKRKIINGKHYIDKVPLNETEFAHDPIMPIKDNNLMSIIKNSELINLEDIRNNLEDRLLNTKNKILIFDTEYEEDLIKISENIVKLKLDRYIIGSAGIMKYLPKFWFEEKKIDFCKFRFYNLKSITKKTIFISGSCSNNNIEQLIYYSKNDDLFKIDLNLKDQKNNFDFENIKENNILIKNISAKSEMYDLIDYFKEKGLSNKEFSNIISDFISEISFKFICENNIKKIFIAGGETCLKVLNRLNIKGLRIVSQIETGIPLTESIDGKYIIITKPGGFGTKEIYSKSNVILNDVDNI